MSVSASAAHEDESAVAQVFLRLLDAARRAERGVFQRVVDGYPPNLAVARNSPRWRPRGSRPSATTCSMPCSLSSSRICSIIRAVHDGRERFRAVRRNRAQARAFPSSHHHSFHRAFSSTLRDSRGKRRILLEIKNSPLISGGCRDTDWRTGLELHAEAWWLPPRRCSCQAQDRR
jgi:hypothetical protein